MEDEHRRCCCRTSNIDAPLVSLRATRSCKRNDRPTPFLCLQVRWALRRWLQTNKSARHSRPREGAKCAPAPLHHPTNNLRTRAEARKRAELVPATSI